MQKVKKKAVIFKWLESVDINRSSTDLAKEFGCSDSYMRKCRRMMSNWTNTKPNQHTAF